MRRDVTPKIVVGPDDTMPDVLTRLRAATGGHATLAIPASSSLFLTASEFRALKSTAESARIILTVETDDRLRRQLATMFHISVVDLLPGAVDELPETESVPDPALAPVPDGDRRRSVPPPPPRWDPQKDIDPDETEAEELPAPTSRRPIPVSPKLAGAVAGGLLLLLVVGLGIAFLLQTATVDLTLRRTPSTADVTFGVAGPEGPPLDGVAFTLTGESVTFDVAYTNTIPVTGVEREPDQAAVGALALRNTSNEPVNIAAGFTFADREGVEYRFPADVTVPPASATDGPGRAEATIEAVTGGEDANREPGMLSGRLENGVYYSNRDAPVAGGTDIKRAVVAREDIDALLASANAELPELARTRGLGDGRQVIPGSIQAGEFSYTLSAEPGDPADTVTINANMTVAAVAFNPADANAQASAELEAALVTNAAAGAEIVPGTTTFATPELVTDGAQSAVFRLQATADTRPLLTDERRAEIAEAIAGMNVDDATAYVASLPEVAGVRIASSPGFLPARIPGDASKIDIETS